tara:strand:- start:173 stop:526 length:354 start_codon:yes stop_codon:yes gene_type:complete
MSLVTLDFQLFVIFTVGCLCIYIISIVFFENKVVIYDDKILVKKIVWKNKLIYIKDIFLVKFYKGRGDIPAFCFKYKSLNNKTKEQCIVFDSKNDMEKVLSFFRDKGIKINRNYVYE